MVCQNRISSVHDRYKGFSALTQEQGNALQIISGKIKRINTKVLLMTLTAQIFIITFDFISVQLPTLKNAV